MADATIYFSDQTHSSVERALRVLGFSHKQMRKLPSDDLFRLNLQDLEDAVRKDRALGKRPFCVVANAGTTNTGAVDPLPALAEYCTHEKLWLHADGAYGAAAIMCERGKGILNGLGLVHSLSLDPHKWLFQPYEIGCVLVRDAKHLKETFHILPEYLRDIEQSGEEINFCDYGIQLTRSFRALKLWMALRIFGAEEFASAVAKGFYLAEYTQGILESFKEFEIVTPAHMAIVTFRYVVPELSEQQIDNINEKIVDSIIQHGFAMISSTTLKGRKVLRMCTINPRTTEEDIKKTIRLIKRYGDHLCPNSF
jgi:glutamate/tyrosine decarboxylase-like PLP-dependent enzyme